VLLAFALTLMSRENFAVTMRINMSESLPSCFIVLRRYGTEKRQLSNLHMPCAYACVEGILTSVMLKLMLVLMSYKKFKLGRSALVRISYVSEYLLRPDLFL